MANGLFLVLPFLTTWAAGATQGAVLALALSFAFTLELVSSGVGMALTAGLSASRERLWERGRHAWIATQVVTLFIGAVLIAAGPLIVKILGSQYRELSVVPVLAVLSAGFAARAAFVIWASVSRAKGRTHSLLIANGLATAVAVPLIIYCADQWGAMGAAIGLSVVATLTGVFGLVGLATSGRYFATSPATN
jgi:O-antigen/teichoic acid export membrane protein